jgi:phosphate transport system permease protein
VALATPPRSATRLRPSRAANSAARRWRFARELVAQGLFLAAAISSVLVTAAIVFVLFRESFAFFREATVLEFLTGTQWAPLFTPPKYGVLPLFAATFVTTAIALAVALPIGLVVSIYLSEFAPHWLREWLKPSLELLSAVPTVVYGYFALQFVSPLLQSVIADLPSTNMLSAGLVMGIMIIPYVSSLSEDAMRSVPMLLREGAYALGGNKITTALRVVLPSAFSGIAAAFILAISRAIGETMIVAIAAGMQPRLTLDPREPAQTVTAYIAATSQGEAEYGTAAYQSIFAVGLALFLITLAFNIVGYLLKRRFHQAY